MAAAKVGAPTWHAERPRRRKRKKRRRLPSACGKRSVNERGLPVSGGLVQVQEADQKILQYKSATKHDRRSARRKLPVNADLAQVKVADQETLQSGLAKEHGKRSGRTRAPANEDPAQAKEDDQLTQKRCRQRSLRRGVHV